MKAIQVRKVKTVRSNNDYYTFFEKGQLDIPLFMLDSINLKFVIRDLCIEAQEIVEEELEFVKKALGE